MYYTDLQSMSLLDLEFKLMTKEIKLLEEEGMPPSKSDPLPLVDSLYRLLPTGAITTTETTLESIPGTFSPRERHVRVLIDGYKRVSIILRIFGEASVYNFCDSEIVDF